ncbi:MAG TPA: hypothetical protein VLB81_05250 [Gaiellales bacterium]|nr:hypothetical protein [Gaiellales bacterium]
MSRPSSGEDRSHGEEYPGGSDPGRPESEEDRYGTKREAPKPDRRNRDEAKPAAPAPDHERNS